MKKTAFLLSLFLPVFVFSQSGLTIEKIMQAPQWIGTSPSNPFWSTGSDTLFFNWNPDKNPSDSLYFITTKNHTPQKATVTQKQSVLNPRGVNYNSTHTALVFAIDGDIFYKTLKDNKTISVTQTVTRENNPVFSFNDKAIVYQSGQNLMSWDIANGQTSQLTNFSAQQQSTGGQGMGGSQGFRGGQGFGSGRGFGQMDGDNQSGSRGGNTGTDAEKWLQNEQFQYMEILRERDEKRKASAAYNRAHQQKSLRVLPTEGKILSGVEVSPDGNNVSYRLMKQAPTSKSTIVPNYVTNTGYTTDIPGRKKVGEPQGSSSLYVYDRSIDSVFQIKTDDWEGIKDIPEFYKDYPTEYEVLKKKNKSKPVNFGFQTLWSPEGKYLLFDARSQDNKDRWIMIWDAASHKLIQADHQHDEAWIAGPGIYGNYGWIDNQTIYYQSEKTGYSHLYLYNAGTGTTRQLTQGNYEVQAAVLSPDKKSFYITTNELEPGQTQFYQLDIASGKQSRVTTMTGGNDVTVSPDGKQIAILYSYTNKPWELYLQDNKPGTQAVQITDKAESPEWKAYPWRDPEIITFTARDGAKVYARVFKPENAKPGAPAVVFVHGAGYLQNAHKWWSSYFRENMFHNFLADNGYYVIDADYRGSAGYGRDWRTGIYRYMGGKDLDDNVDAAKYLVDKYGVDAHRIGVYGGSYGGFITLMAMFTAPDVFAAGAGLRSVTEWANYNHGYTSNILNEPQNDSIAYRRSSPIYFAKGLKGHLLMCHGLIDTNVHAQDIIKVSQRLIELRKENWELALFPVEDHGFVEPTSWMDEYKRIFKLFETVLKAK